MRAVVRSLSDLALLPDIWRWNVERALNARRARKDRESGAATAPATDEATALRNGLRLTAAGPRTLPSLPDNLYFRRLALDRQRRQARARVRREAEAIGREVVADINLSTGTPGLPSASAVPSGCIFPARSRPTCPGGAI